MKLYECNICGNRYYKKIKECIDCKKELTELEVSEREVILVILEEISSTCDEYEAIYEEELEEKVGEKIGRDFDCTEYSFALDKAIKNGLFSKRIIYISGT